MSLKTGIAEELWLMNEVGSLVGEHMDFARPYEAQRQPVAVEELLEGALEAARRIASAELGPLKVQLQLSAELPQPQWDSQLMRQALLNLILNGLQSMGAEGGTLTLCAVPQAELDRPCIRITIEDSGPGISPAARDQLFLPFFTTKASGTGLGLSVVKRIVEAHGGEIFVEPRSPRGAAFTMRLPCET